MAEIGGLEVEIGIERGEMIGRIEEVGIEAGKEIGVGTIRKLGPKIRELIDPGEIKMRMLKRVEVRKRTKFKQKREKYLNHTIKPRKVGESRVGTREIKKTRKEAKIKLELKREMSLLLPHHHLLHHQVRLHRALLPVLHLHPLRNL